MSCWWNFIVKVANVIGLLGLSWTLHDILISLVTITSILLILSDRARLNPDLIARTSIIALTRMRIVI